MSLDDKKRRDFLKQATSIGILSLITGAGIVLAPKLKSNELLLRPPRAVEEERFLKLCIKCGQCLQVCPYDAIRLEDIDGGASLGMAYIEPNKRGCYLCEALPCVLACPTGALDHEYTDIKHVNMGIAVVKNLDACLAIYNKKPPKEFINEIYNHTNILTNIEKQTHNISINSSDSEKNKLQKEVLFKLEKNKNSSCDLCVSMCPYPSVSDAIGMISYKGGLIPEIREACVGCGVCEEMCPVDIIEIKPRETYKKGVKNV